MLLLRGGGGGGEVGNLVLLEKIVYRSREAIFGSGS